MNDDNDNDEQAQDYRVRFKDGTSFVMAVLDEDSPTDEAVRVCEQNGYPLDDIEAITRE